MTNNKNSETPDLAGSDVSKSEKQCVTILSVIGEFGNGSATGREEDCGSVFVTPYTNKGGDKYYPKAFDVPEAWEDKNPVINDRESIGLHWLTLTLFCNKGQAFEFYKEFLFDYFGELAEENHGLLGYRSVATGSFGFKIAYEPVTVSKHHGSSYVSFIIPGAACERLEPSWLRMMASECHSRNIEFTCTRLDYKFDQVNFSPYQFRYMLQNNVKFMKASREKIRHIQNDDLNEAGNPGNITVYVGSKSSDRVICCYDTHGFTRLEMRNKGQRAMLIFFDLVMADCHRWQSMLKGYLLDYLDLDHILWEYFVINNSRSYMKIINKPDSSLDELENWIINQGSALISTLYDIKGDKWFKNILAAGREKRKKLQKYGVLLHRYGVELGQE
jgi:hypothetical protein